MRLLHRHRWVNAKPVGEYYSITGPRVVFQAYCADPLCNKYTEWTVRGEMRYMKNDS